MSQLKFVRSKSTIKSNPLGRLQQKLKQVQKPGKLHVSVGRSRQSSQNNEEFPISTPKHKLDLKPFKLHQINENTVPLSKSDGWHSLLPLSHHTKLINDSNKLQNSSQSSLNYENIYNKQHYYTQTNYCSPKLSECTKYHKFDTFQFKSNKLNLSDQQSSSDYFSNTTSKFNSNQFLLKSSQIINQQWNSDYEQSKLDSITNFNIHNKCFNENYISSHEQIKISSQNENRESNIQDIYSTISKKNQVTTKPIIEQNEDDELLAQKCSTAASQRLVPKFYSEILTEKSLILNVPKMFKETEIQTSFTQNQQTDLVESQKSKVTCKSSTNVSVQTKSKTKKLGLYQYHLSYLSPKVNKNFIEADLLSYDDFKSQIICSNQNNIQNKNEPYKLREEIDFNNRSQILGQQNNIYLTKELILDPQDDTQPFYLQAEPKEINPNLLDKNYNNKLNISKEFTQNSCTSISKSKIDKCASFQSIKSYKDHLNILLNQTSQTNCKNDQNQPYIVQQNKTNTTNKQKYPLRHQQSNKNITQQQKSKQFKKK
ncbi:unnamed protein product [Paramecium sonneborni]|uniref:Uncharacterized protein n=1 Tax=Paramecium sonneborni TaxID=65129 RepID=A0A8S1R398_9CILI|nr:unnamed protein product [Paramecium sonneborni]